MNARARWLRCLGLLGIVFLACSLWAAGLLICPKCGTEADANVTVCAHCGALLPVKVAPAPATNTEATADKNLAAISDMALEAARADKRRADDNLVKRPELAYAYYENALALSRLVKRDGLPADAGKLLADSLERCHKVLTTTTRPCPACSGGGKRSIQFEQLSGDKSAHTALAVAMPDGPACSVCGGRGVVPAGRSADDLRVQIGQGRRDFDMQQKAVGRVASGRVWAPSELLPLLDVKAQALLRTACPTPCTACMGLGVQDCPRCKSVGKVKCNNDGCANGWINVKSSNTLNAKTAISRKERCPVCQGTGMMACTDCRGAGTVPCKICNGTGRNAVCAECGGQGWGVCAKCQGTGSIGGATCPDCRGTKERLCPKCHGEGCAVR